MLHIQGQNVIVSSKYERLPYFYFSCGVNIHIDFGSPINSASSYWPSTSSKQYGTWLQAVASSIKSGVGYHIGGQLVFKNLKDPFGYKKYSYSSYLISSQHSNTKKSLFNFKKFNFLFNNDLIITTFSNF